MPIPDFPIRDAAYFRAQGKQLLQYFKRREWTEDVVPSGVLWARIAYVQRLWGIPTPASGDADEMRMLVLACFIEVLY